MKVSFFLTTDVTNPVTSSDRSLCSIPLRTVFSRFGIKSQGSERVNVDRRMHYGVESKSRSRDHCKPRQDT